MPGETKTADLSGTGFPDQIPCLIDSNIPGNKAITFGVPELRFQDSLGPVNKLAQAEPAFNAQFPARFMRFAGWDGTDDLVLQGQYLQVTVQAAKRAY